MTENATPSRQRPTHFPAAIPRTMTTQAQRDAIDKFAEDNGYGKAEALRVLIDLGLHTAHAEEYPDGA